MIHTNPMISHKLVRSDSKKNTIAKNIIKSIIFRKFQISLMKSDIFL